MSHNYYQYWFMYLCLSLKIAHIGKEKVSDQARRWGEMMFALFVLYLVFRGIIHKKSDSCNQWWKVPSCSFYIASLWKFQKYRKNVMIKMTQTWSYYGLNMSKIWYNKTMLDGTILLASMTFQWKFENFQGRRSV